MSTTTKRREATVTVPVFETRADGNIEMTVGDNPRTFFVIGHKAGRYCLTGHDDMWASVFGGYHDTLGAAIDHALHRFTFPVR
jgi:hypothetical protein